MCEYDSRLNLDAIILTILTQGIKQQQRNQICLRFTLFFLIVRDLETLFHLFAFCKCHAKKDGLCVLMFTKG